MACAFINSQSTAAHCHLFEHLFHIVKEDTGQDVQFLHIHGTGIHTITVDGHKGQALGVFYVIH